jgi:uridylate kinase
MGSLEGGLDPARLQAYAQEIKSITDLKVQTTLVIGGGNIFRGLQGTGTVSDRVQGDYMGMLATLINSLALQAELEKAGVETIVLSTLMMEPMAGLMSRRNAVGNLERGRVVIVAGGTGNPYFTTDTAAVLRALETGSQIILKGTRVDGVYTADPEKDTKATKYDTLTFDEAWEKKLQILDLTAFTLCRENKLPLLVFNINVPGNLKKAVTGEKVGTLVTV